MPRDSPLAPPLASTSQQIIVDLSASNERLETENRKLKVAAIGMMATLRELGHPASAAELNVSGMGLYSGHDDGAKSTEDVSSDKEKGAGGAPRKAGPTLKKAFCRGRRDRDGAAATYLVHLFIATTFGT